MIDLDQIVDDAKARLEADLDTDVKVFAEADARDFTLLHQKIVDVRLVEEAVDPRPGYQHVLYVNFEFECAGVNLTSRREACKIRNKLVSDCQEALRKGPKFTHVGGATAVILGNVKFAVERNEQAKKFTASAVCQAAVVCVA